MERFTAWADNEVFNEAFLEEVRTHHAELIKSGLKAAAEEPEISADLETELRDRFTPVPEPSGPPNLTCRRKAFGICG